MAQQRLAVGIIWLEVIRIEVIELYEAGSISYEEFQDFMWGSGQRLINEIGQEKFVFYLLAEAGVYYERRWYACLKMLIWIIFLSEKIRIAES